MQTRNFGTAEDVAALLGGLVSVQKVYLMARENIIPCIKLGRRVVFDMDKVERWIEDGGTGWPGGWRKAPQADEAA